MSEFSDRANFTCIRPPVRIWLAFLLCLQIVTCCWSLVQVAELYHAHHYVMFDKTRPLAPLLNVIPFALVSILFTVSRFSFGYVLGFYFYTMILGYLWLVEFSRFHYDHQLASISAFVSALAFLLPVLFIISPIKQKFVLSERALDVLLWVILLLAATVIGVGALYNFRLIGLAEIYTFRGALEFPAVLRYAMGAMSNALLPFAFACFFAQGNRLRASIALLLLLLFYPITLTKLTLFSPFWLLFLVLLSKFFEARISVVLSLFLPTLIGIILMLLFESGVVRHALVIDYFGAVNFRMIALPSMALDYYNDFFSTHDRTYFCQISFLKPFVDCSYADPLSVVMEKAYQFGNLNASLFATEGIASVGLVQAPFVALACGLLLSIANRLSFDLPSRFILLSGGILPQVFLNVPFTTTLLTNGAAILFLLWYVTPRSIFSVDNAR